MLPKMKKIFFIFGTRPEAIKMAPLILELQKFPDIFSVQICVTAQHRQMLDQVLSFFEIKPDFDLDVMKPNQTLFEITGSALLMLRPILEKEQPSLIFIQGDTTTAMVGALAGYYLKIPVAHLEAGLRSGNKYSPFPEEVNRKIAGHIADFHFAPTVDAVLNLNREGVVKNVWNVGNTVIDALHLGLERIKKHDFETKALFKNIDFNHQIILITGHRRESFGGPFEEICWALREIAESFNTIELIYPVHLNPNVREPVNRILGNMQRVHLIEPLDYPAFIWLLKQSFFVMTDSGGIQEEAPSLGKPVLVMRDVTERMEGVHAGTAVLVGTNREQIIGQASKLLTDVSYYQHMANAKNPYGDGNTAIKIKNLLISNT